MEKIKLIIESTKEGVLWGRVNYEDNLLIESAESLEQLQVKIKNLLTNFHNLELSSIDFDVSFNA
ncbi:hypothetical protein [Arcicella rosea]|uniref:Uncharacterized protein n=1 Tax=Arcicella rosea TaxID=502909 RepID=A0A841EJE2_9BACT|nr:hypothetical protein [Arcicella rosea]MBB6002334.1 hypothetical protein [Arcicella rosea]